MDTATFGIQLIRLGEYLRKVGAALHAAERGMRPQTMGAVIVQTSPTQHVLRVDLPEGDPEELTKALTMCGIPVVVFYDENDSSKPIGLGFGITHLGVVHTALAA